MKQATFDLNTRKVVSRETKGRVSYYVTFRVKQKAWTSFAFHVKHRMLLRAFDKIPHVSRETAFATDVWQ